MKIKSPEDIDLLFKETLDSSDVTYNPSHWTRLETQLNLSAQRSAKLKLRYQWIAGSIVAIVAGVLLYFWISKENVKPVEPVSSNINIVTDSLPTELEKVQTVPTELEKNIEKNRHSIQDTATQALTKDSTQSPSNPEDTDHTIFW